MKEKLSRAKLSFAVISHYSAAAQTFRLLVQQPKSQSTCAAQAIKKD